MNPAHRSPQTLSDVLQGVEWLHEFPAPFRERVFADAYESYHARGNVVSRTGDPATSWIGVAEGVLKVTVVSKTGRVTLFTGVSRGAWIGEGAVIKRELRRYDIVAMRDSRLIHIPSSTFRWLLDTSIEFNRIVINSLNERLSQFISTVEIDRLEDPLSRVARMLSSWFNPLLYPRMTATVPLLQSEVGELVGLSRQSVSAALRTLQREGYIKVGYGGITVENVLGLRDFEESHSSSSEAGKRVSK